MPAGQRTANMTIEEKQKQRQNGHADSGETISAFEDLLLALVSVAVTDVSGLSLCLNFFSAL
jgi:hypothetical protein